MPIVDPLERSSALPAQSFLETLPLAVYVCDSPSGEIRRYNRAARELWGDAPRPGTVLCGAMRLFLPDGTPLPTEQCPMAFAVREGKSYADQYVLMQRADGRRFIANVNIAPIRDAGGQLLGAINAFQDVTARRRTEMLLDAQRRLLERILAGEAVESVLDDAARAAERFALWRARALIYVAEGARLRLAAAPGIARPAPEIEELPLAAGASAAQALPASLPLDGEACLAYAVPLHDAKGAPLGVFALYEPPGAATQDEGHEDLELVVRTAAFALERKALVEAEAQAVRHRDQSMRVAREAEAAARATAEQFRLLLEGLPAAAYTCDAQGRITYFNRRAAELWGREPRLRDPQELYCGSYKLYLGDGEPIAHSQCWMARALLEDRRYEGQEVRIERPDGAIATALAHAMPFHDDKGAVSGAVNVLVDISARKAAENTLRASEEWLRAIVETTPECVKLVASDGTLLQMNASGLAMVGATQAAEVVGKNVYELIAPEDRAAFIAFNERVCSGERGSLEFDIVGLGGRRRRMETHAAPLADGEGRLVQLAVTRDVTERRRTEAERERFAAQLAESDRRKDEFIATLSHELRNPLAPLKTSVELLGRAPRDPATLERLQPIMARQVDHLVRLVDDLLEASRITQGALELRSERITLESVLRQALETSRPAIDAAGHELVLELPQEPLWLEGDGVRLVQILSNLVNNAAKYTDPKGRIEVRVRRDGEHATAVVRDNGIGIAPERAPRLFEMFARSGSADPRGKSGLGVGLALARRLAEMHGGTLVARSDGPGTGSEFELRLPLAQPPAAAEAARAAPQSALAHAQRVLVVDDNRDAADTLGLLLRTVRGVDARTAHDGAAALALAESFAPDIVLLDIGMPGMDGYEVARAMRTRFERRVMLVALTGWGQAHDRERALAAGFDHHLVKPARLEDVQALLARAREHEPSGARASV